MENNVPNIFVLANGDEWQGLYLNGVMQVQGHEVLLHAAMELACRFPPTTYLLREVDTDWLDNVGHLPTNINDVKWDES